MPQHSSPRPDPRQVYAIAAHTGRDPRTIKAWLGGREPHGLTLKAQLEEAAQLLGIERSSAEPKKKPAK